MSFPSLGFSFPMDLSWTMDPKSQWNSIWELEIVAESKLRWGLGRDVITERHLKANHLRRKRKQIQKIYKRINLTFFHFEEFPKKCYHIHCKYMKAKFEAKFRIFSDISRRKYENSITVGNIVNQITIFKVLLFSLMF